MSVSEPSSPSHAPSSRRAWAHVIALTGGNGAVAALGFLGNYLLVWALDVAAFAAIGMFLAAFQFLQDGLGRSLNWALVRVVPRAERQQPGHGAVLLVAAADLQRRFALAGLVLAPLAFAVGRLLPDSTAASMIALASLAAAGAVLFQFELGRLQLGERFFAFSSWLVSQSLLRVCAWAVLWLLGWLDLTTAIAAHLLSTWALLVGVRTSTGSLPRLSANAADRAAVWQIGGPMVLATTCAAVAAQVDLFVLDATSDAGTTARYRLIVLLATVIELATSSVMTAMLPRAGRAHTPDERKASLRANARWGAGIAALGLCSYPLVAWALPNLFPPEYAPAAALWPIVLIGVLATALTDPLGLQFLSRDRPQRYVWLNAITLVVVLAGNLLLPGDDRSTIAAWVRTTSRLLLAAGILFLLWRDRHASSPNDSAPGSKPA